MRTMKIKVKMCLLGLFLAMWCAWIFSSSARHGGSTAKRQTIFTDTLWAGHVLGSSSTWLTFPPEAEAPLGHGDFAVLDAVAGIEERLDARLVLVQVDGGQLAGPQVQVAVSVQFPEHPQHGVLAAGQQAPFQRCKRQTGELFFCSLHAFTAIDGKRRQRSILTGGWQWMSFAKRAFLPPWGYFCLFWESWHVKANLRQWRPPACCVWRFRAATGTNPRDAFPSWPGPRPCSSLKRRRNGEQTHLRKITKNITQIYIEIWKTACI